MLVGGLRALLLQTLHPPTLAGVTQHSTYQTDPLGRLQPHRGVPRDHHIRVPSRRQSSGGDGPARCTNTSSAPPRRHAVCRNRSPPARLGPLHRGRQLPSGSYAVRLRAASIRHGRPLCRRNRRDRCRTRVIEPPQNRQDLRERLQSYRRSWRYLPIRTRPSDFLPFPPCRLWRELRTALSSPLPHRCCLASRSASCAYLSCR